MEDARIRDARRRRSVRGGVSYAALIALAFLAFVAIAAAAFVLIVRPPFAQPLLSGLGLGASPAASTSGASSQTDSGELFAEVGDIALTDSEAAAEQAMHDEARKTKLIARYDDVDLRSCIEPSELTGLLFHQASYNYALVLSTELPEADYEKTAAARQIRVNREGGKGEWLDADALHIWRTSDTTPMDTSIDIGAAAGTSVRSPITGTVVLVQDYMLYEQVPDIQIHIQPDGRDDLDCVLLHTTDPCVNPGDHVEAGLTEICKVRDIEKDLTDVQLAFFTPEGVGGNHVHVQINDANYENYRKEKLKGAYKVKKSDA